ncbi:serine hydrolase domain-containing protein [Streptomyces sp. CAU 1734]|uniref:serine hydrolase domain-containing protein n=1 Tax=Streptomyces sp. CAU 1734 TaxID=3140360 RepID=UPI003260EB5A
MIRKTLRRKLSVPAVAAGVLVALTGPAGAAGGGEGARGPARIQALMRADLEKAADRLGGLARIQEGRRSWSAAVGVADPASGRPRRADERFRIGSVTKTFVATVLLQLQGEGRIDLDDTVERWLPGLVRGNGNDGSAITVRQLLNHTSGLFRYDRDPGIAARLFTSAFLTHRYDTHRPGELVRAALAHPPAFAPGTGRQYSNTNYILAGMIIEEVTGRSYGAEIERRLIRPLKLTSTFLPGTRTGIPGPHARAHSRFFAADPGVPLHDVTELNPSSGGAAGEMISSLRDLTRFHTALMRGRLLPRAELDEMLTRTPEELGPAGGLGLSPSVLPCEVTVWGHDGGIHGWSSLILATEDGGRAAAFNYNADSTGSFGRLAAAAFCD